MQVSFSPEQMAPLDKKCQPFTFTGCLLEGKKTREKEGGAQPPAAITDIPIGGGKEGWGQSGWWWWGVFWRGRHLIVFNKGTFIFVLRPVTASGNSSVS